MKNDFPTWAELPETTTEAVRGRKRIVVIHTGQPAGAQHGVRSWSPEVNRKYSSLGGI